MMMASEILEGHSLSRLLTEVKGHFEHYRRRWSGDLSRGGRIPASRNRRAGGLSLAALLTTMMIESFAAGPMVSLEIDHQLAKIGRHIL